MADVIPFAALDSQDVQVQRTAADEFASRFPSLDVKFRQASPTTNPTLSKRVVEALVDNAIALPPATKVDSVSSATILLTFHIGSTWRLPS
jgi:AP2-associated kinase